MTTGRGNLVASAGITIMLPGGMAIRSPLALLRLAVPSRQINFIHAPGLYSIMVVVPVMAAVTVAVRIVAPPAFFGTCRRKDPWVISISREPELNRNAEFAPILVIVLSGKVSSARDCLPVSTVERPVSRSPSLAVRASFELSLILTSLIFFVRTADLRGAAWAMPTAIAAAVTNAGIFIILYLIVVRISERPVESDTQSGRP